MDGFQQTQSSGDDGCGRYRLRSRPGQRSNHLGCCLVPHHLPDVRIACLRIWSALCCLAIILAATPIRGQSYSGDGVFRSLRVRKEATVHLNERHSFSQRELPEFSGTYCGGLTPSGLANTCRQEGTSRYLWVPRFNLPVGTSSDPAQTRDVVLVPLGMVGGESESLLDAREYDFASSIVDTGLYIKWPINHEPERCNVVLETNKFTESDCSQVNSCHNVGWFPVEATWYGKEVGVCLGNAEEPLHINSGGVPIEDDGLPSSSWGKFYKFKDPPERVDPCRVIKYLGLIRLPTKDVIFAFSVFRNFAVYRTSTRSLEPYNFEFHSNAGRPCPSMFPVPLHNTAIIYEGRTLNHWPHEFPVVTYRLRQPFVPRCPYEYNGANFALSEGLWVSGKQSLTFGTAYTNYTHRVCMNHRFETSYSLPGSQFVRNTVSTIFRVLFDILAEVVQQVWNSAAAVFHQVDENYRLSEVCVIIIVTAVYFDSAYKIGVGVALYATTVGLRR
jgi:hypothetical protein